jgi:hypothetical protein
VVARLSRGSRWFLGFIVVVLLLGAGGLYALQGRLGPIGDDVEPGQPVEVSVEPRATLPPVGEELAEVGVVR